MWSVGGHFEKGKVILKTYSIFKKRWQSKHSTQCPDSLAYSATYKFFKMAATIIQHQGHMKKCNKKCKVHEVSKLISLLRWGSVNFGNKMCGENAGISWVICCSSVTVKSKGPFLSGFVI